VVAAVKRRIKTERRSKILAWDTPHVLSSAARACVLLGEELAAADIGDAWLRLADRPVQELPEQCPTGIESIAWVETLLASASPSGGHCVVLPAGIPQPWWGAPFEAHGLTADPYRTMSYAVRWHGARPAMLWEVSGSPGLLLSGGDGNSSWQSTDASGEALLAAPVVAES
jgi:hypothetical protein